MADDLNVEMRACAAYEKMRDLVMNRSAVYGNVPILDAWEHQPHQCREDWRAAIRAADKVEEEAEGEIAAEAIAEADSHPHDVGYVVTSRQFAQGLWSLFAVPFGGPLPLHIEDFETVAHRCLRNLSLLRPLPREKPNSEYANMQPRDEAGDEHC